MPRAPWLVLGVRAIATHESGLRAGLRVLTLAPRPLPHGATGATLVMVDATLGYHWRWLRLAATPRAPRERASGVHHCPACVSTPRPRICSELAFLERAS